jgi:hypothetical protein
MAAPPAAQGQTLSVLYTFTSLADGYSPGSLTVDAAGNLYGTTPTLLHALKSVWPEDYRW